MLIITVLLITIGAISVLLVLRERNQTSNSKIDFLEGVRGVASLMVVGAHFIEMFYPAMLFGGKSLGGVIAWLCASPAFLLYSGRAAVTIFFVLSGFALSFATLSSGRWNQPLGAIFRRYPRLLIPIVFTSCIYMLLMSVGWISHETLKNLDHWTHTPMAYLYDFRPSAEDVIKFSFVDTFTHATGKYNLSLWTIHFEFLGSIMVYGLLLIPCRFLDFRSRMGLFAIVAIFLFSRPYYFCFVVGMALCDIYCNAKVLRPRIALALLVFGVYGAGYPLFMPPEIKAQWYVWQPLASDEIISGGSCMLVAAIVLSRSLQNVFNSTVCAFLGKISFSMYLLHMAVLLAVSGPTFLFFRQYLNHDMSAGLSILISLPIIVGISYATYFYVDRAAVIAPKKMYSYVSEILERRLLPLIVKR